MHTENTDSSAFTVNTERISQFLADSITMTDTATNNPVSHTGIIVSSDQTQATQSRGGKNASNITQFPDAFARIVLTHSYLSPNTGKFTCP